ncbi:MAG: hypothetical protein QXV17_01530 [Candidatus Micrarchaeaceae archaeon]
MKKNVILVTKSLPLIFDYTKGRYYQRGEVIENYTKEMEQIVINHPDALAFVEITVPDDVVKESSKEIPVKEMPEVKDDNSVNVNETDNTSTELTPSSKRLKNYKKK